MSGRLWVGMRMERANDTCTILPVRTLFLDTASKEPSLALCSKEETLALKPRTLHRRVRGHVPQKDSTLIPTLEALLRDAGVTYEDLTHLACVIGPGGFTSLRIGVATANTLAYALGLPSVGVHLSDLWARRVQCVQKSVQKSVHTFLWLHSTRKTQLFVRGYGSFEKQYPEPTLVELEEAMKLKGPYVGELIEEHQRALTGCEPIDETSIVLLKDMLPKFLRDLPYKKQQLVPWYGREA